MARATTLQQFTGTGGSFGVVPWTPPPITPLKDQGWSCVMGNLSPYALEVFFPGGSKWVQPFTADVLGSNCAIMVVSEGTSPFNIVWSDLANTGISGTFTVTFSWATEPDSDLPSAGVSYPHAVSA